jgi:tetratricopeptide (TPR) repeat protein
MSCWDADVAFKFRQTLIDKAPTCNEKQGRDLFQDVSSIYARYYPLQPSKDMAFELGRMCMGLRRHHEAAALFWASVRHAGEHHVTLYNIGICLFHLGDSYMRGALIAFNRSLSLNPAYEDALAWRTRAVAKLEAAVVKPAAHSVLPGPEAALEVGTDGEQHSSEAEDSDE